MSDSSRIDKILSDLRATNEYRLGYLAGLEAAAKLCERVRCRNWDALECAMQIRTQLKVEAP